MLTVLNFGHPLARAFPSANIIRLHREGREPFMPAELRGYR